MHFEILSEDISGKAALEILLPKIIDTEIHSYRVIPYKGIGRLPKNLKPTSDANKRILLDQLPNILRGYGNYLAGDQNYAIVVVCDLDRRCLKDFRKELLDLTNAIYPLPITKFCIAIEEGEAWLLGDFEAIKLAYPGAKEAILHSYTNDEICGTWQKLADAVYDGGSQKLSKLGWRAVGIEKSLWAKNISSYMDINENKSPSFCYFRDKLLALIQ
jgi:hypothetical protein